MIVTRKRNYLREYEQRHQTTSAYASRGSSPASSVEIESENPLPSHLKGEKKQGILQQDQAEQFEFDINNTETKLEKQTQAKTARRNRKRRNSPAPPTTQITRKRERKRVEKTYSRKRTDAQFLRRNPDMPLSFRPAEEIEKFRINARGGDTNRINYKEKSETFRSLEIAKRRHHVFRTTFLKSNYERMRNVNKTTTKNMHEVRTDHKTTRDMEKERTLPSIITNPDHREYEYWKDPSDPQWIGKPGHLRQIQTQEATRIHPRTSGKYSKTIQEGTTLDSHPCHRTIRRSNWPSWLPGPQDHLDPALPPSTSSLDNGSDNDDSSQSGSSTPSESPDLVTIKVVTGQSLGSTIASGLPVPLSVSRASLTPQCHSEKAARASLAGSCTSSCQLASLDEAALHVDSVNVGLTIPVTQSHQGLNGPALSAPS